MVNVKIRKNANYAVVKCQYGTVCSKCHGPVRTGEECVSWNNKADKCGVICKKCKEAVEANLRERAERRK